MRVAGTWCDEWRGLQVDAVDRRHMVGMEFRTEVECARDKAGVGAVADSHGSSLATRHVVVGCGEQLDTRVVSLHVVWVIVKDVDNAAARRFGFWQIRSMICSCAWPTAQRMSKCNTMASSEVSPDTAPNTLSASANSFRRYNQTTIGGSRSAFRILAIDTQAGAIWSLLSIGQSPALR